MSAACTGPPICSSALDAAPARARGGQGQVAAVAGPGGIGKTRLLAATRKHLAQALDRAPAEVA